MQTRRQNLLELHSKVQANIEKRNEQYAMQANKGMRKERFSTQRKYKLQPRGDETFQVLKRINDNAYTLDLSTAYGNCWFYQQVAIKVTL
ncbi:hypothetical protein CR513_32835, partial [Mucuna pruriens]